MATITSGSVYAMNFNLGEIGAWSYLTLTRQDGTYTAGDLRTLGLPNAVTEFFGHGFGYDRLGAPVEGVVNGYRESLDGAMLIEVSGLSVAVSQVNDWVARNASAEALQTLLAGPDRITGSPFEDTLRGYGGDDTILGGGGNDQLRGDAGNDLLDGGAGVDTALYAGPASNYRVVVAPGITGVIALQGSELALDGMDKLIAIEKLGFAEGAQTVNVGPVNFLPVSYSASYADLMSAFGRHASAAFDHFLDFGAAEGRQVTFHGLEYIASHGDLMAALGADAEAGAGHYIQHGHAEGRQVSFDGLDYIASYGDLIAAFGPNADAGAVHFIQHGHAEGRQASFDGLEYIASYGDLIAAFGPDAEAGAAHFIQYGHTEQRATDGFDAARYLANYADLQAAFGNDLTAATRHWIVYGFGEGRSDEPLMG